MSFWNELRRRKVVRATLAYLAAAFVVAQVAQLLSDALELPGNFLKIVVIVEIALLPLVIAAAWAFDWSSQGVHQTDTAAPPIRWRRIAPAALATLTLLGVGLAYALRTPDVQLDNNLVAVLPFRVSGSNDIAYLREGMMDLLSAKLTGEGGPRAADPRSTMSALKALEEDPNSISEDNALAVARSLGAGYVLLGSAVGTSAQLTINATLTDVRTGKKVPVERTGSADTLAAFIDHFAAELLSLRAGEDRRLAALTSTSLSALRAYLAAQSDYRASRFESAIRNYQRALEIDSTFALAAMGHILSTGWGAVPDTTENRSRRILAQHAGRLSEIDQIMATALIGPTEGVRTVRRQLDAWETVLAKAPDRSEAWFLYGDALLHLGGLAGVTDSRDRAIRAFRKSLQIDSAHTPALVHLLDNAMLIRDRATVLHLDSLRAARGTPRQSYQALIMYHLMGDSAAVRRVRAGIDTLSLDVLYAIALTPTVYGVGAADAVRALEEVLERAALPGEQSTARSFAHALLLGYGHPKRAAEVAELRMSAEPGERTILEVVEIMDALYANGDSAAAARTFSRLATSNVRSTERLAGDCAVEQWRLWHGQPSRAINVARDLRALKLTGSDRNSAMLCAYLLEALHAVTTNPAGARPTMQAFEDYLKVGPRADERLLNAGNIAAARMWERLGDREAAYRAISRQAFHPAYFHYSQAMMREQARLAALVGKRDDAVQLYQRYLQMQDAAHPSRKADLDQVRRELSRLTAANN